MTDRQIVPLSFYQRHRMLAAALDPETSPRFHRRYNEAWAVRIKPGLSLRKIERAFRNLTQRHDGLRTRIIEHKGDWAAEILPQHPVGVVVEDHGPLPREAQEAIILEKCARHKTALDPALFDMELLRFGAEGDILLTRGEHSIYDAYSVAIVMVEGFSYLLDIPVTGTAMSQQEFLAYRARQEQHRAAEKQAYWEDVMLPAPPMLNVGRHKRNMPPLTRQTMGPIHPPERIFTPKAVTRLKETFQKTGHSPNVQMQVAFAEAVCAMGGGSETIWRSGMGRQDARLANYVGVAAQLLPVRYAVGDGAKGLSEQIAKGSDMQPCTLLATASPITMLPYQLTVNMPKPLGKLENSPLRNMLGERDWGSFSLGPMTFEHVPTGIGRETDYELELNVDPSSDSPNAEFYADAASWEKSELDALSAAMNEVILS